MKIIEGLEIDMEKLMFEKMFKRCYVEKQISVVIGKDGKIENLGILENKAMQHLVCLCYVEKNKYLNGQTVYSITNRGEESYELWY